MKKYLLAYAILFFAFTAFAQRKHEIRIGVQPFSITNSIALNYELYLEENHSLFLDLTYFEKQRSIIDINNVLNNPPRRTYPFSILAIRLGGHLYFGNKPLSKWGIGLAMLGEIELDENEEYFLDLRRVRGILPDREIGRLATSLSVHHKWLIDDKWTIQPMFIADLGLEFSTSDVPNLPNPPPQFFLNSQLRVYVGYRFGGRESLNNKGN